MIHVKADGQPLILPGSFDEMKLHQFFTYIEAGDDGAAILSALSGVDLATIRQLRTPDLSSLFGSHLAYLTEEVDFTSLPVPSVLFIGEQKVKPPMNLGSETTFGQKTDIDRAIRTLNDEGKPANFLTLARVLLSTYLLPAISGHRYESQDQCEAILPIINGLPVTDALALSAFFLSSYKQMMSSGRMKLTVCPKQSTPYCPSKLLKWWMALKTMMPTLLSSR